MASVPPRQVALIQPYAIETHLVLQEIEKCRKRLQHKRSTCELRFPQSREHFTGRGFRLSLVNKSFYELQKP